MRVNQELAPGDFTDQGVGWKDLGTYNITGDTLTVQLSDDADDYVIADAIRIERVSSVSILDNEEGGFSTVGDWSPYPNEGYQDGIH